VFCDINPRTLTADPNDIERRITPKTRAIMVVHVWGNPAEVDAVRALADRHDLALVEDCSHAHGAIYKGQPVGAWGDIGCFSLQGGKPVSAGEGGIAVCNRRQYYARMLALGHPIRAGSELKEDGFDLGMIHLGPKYRPHLLGLLLALSSLARLPQLNQLRRRNWQLFCEGLTGCEELSPVETIPGAERGGFLEFKFILNTDRLRVSREQIIKDLQAEGVPAAPDRYGSLHRVAALRRGGPITLETLQPASPVTDAVPELPHTEALRERVVTLPAFAKVPEKYVRQVAAAMAKVVRHRAK
jgi:dTDP-4-amino-4,6-dideoxygalactose transaminase